jgi:hypothetical protein
LHSTEGQVVLKRMRVGPMCRDDFSRGAVAVNFQPRHGI